MTRRQRKARYTRRRAAQAMTRGAAVAVVAAGVGGHVHHGAEKLVSASELAETPAAGNRPVVFRYDPDEHRRGEPLTLTTISFAGTTATGVVSPWELFVSNHPGARLDWS